jgi:hypothetical protein
MNLSERNEYLKGIAGELTERQKVAPALAGQAFGQDKKARPGAFKVSKSVLDAWKRDGIQNPEEHLFDIQRKSIANIPRQELAKVWADNVPDAQDVIARNPKKAFRTWMKNFGKIRPKFNAVLRRTPEMASLWFYASVLSISGRMMADEIFKKHFVSQKKAK